MVLQINREKMMKEMNKYITGDNKQMSTIRNMLLNFARKMQEKKSRKL